MKIFAVCKNDGYFSPTKHKLAVNSTVSFNANNVLYLLCSRSSKQHCGVSEFMYVNAHFN